MPDTRPRWWSDGESRGPDCVREERPKGATLRIVGEGRELMPCDGGIIEPDHAAGDATRSIPEPVGAKDIGEPPPPGGQGQARALDQSRKAAHVSNRRVGLLSVMYD